MASTVPIRISNSSGNTFLNDGIGDAVLMQPQSFELFFNQTHKPRNAFNGLDADISAKEGRPGPHPGGGVFLTAATFVATVFEP
jgi:hypothetical protein